MRRSEAEPKEPTTPRAKGAPPKRRWVQVRVLTDEGAYLGRLRLEATRTALHDLITDARTYLALWDAATEDAPQRREFVAIHKSAIRAVILLGELSVARLAA